MDLPIAKFLETLFAGVFLLWTLDILVRVVRGRDHQFDESRIFEPYEEALDLFEEHTKKQGVDEVVVPTPEPTHVKRQLVLEDTASDLKLMLVEREEPRDPQPDPTLASLRSWFLAIGVLAVVYLAGLVCEGISNKFYDSPGFEYSNLGLVWGREDELRTQALNAVGLEVDGVASRGCKSKGVTIDKLRTLGCKAWRSKAKGTYYEANNLAILESREFAGRLAELQENIDISRSLAFVFALLSLSLCAGLFFYGQCKQRIGVLAAFIAWCGFAGWWHGAWLLALGPGGFILGFNVVIFGHQFVTRDKNKSAVKLSIKLPKVTRLLVASTLVMFASDMIWSFQEIERNKRVFGYYSTIQAKAKREREAKAKKRAEDERKVQVEAKARAQAQVEVEEASRAQQAAMMQSALPPIPADDEGETGKPAN